MMVEGLTHLTRKGSVAVTTLHNFGRNLVIQPTAFYEPADEAEVLAILDRHRGEQIRVVGRLHSWSDAPSGQGVVLNLNRLAQVELRQAGEGAEVVVGAGCQIKSLLARLKEQGWTLPSVGLINEQSIAGTISTGTHGSGRHSLSHYVAAIRVARYDESTGAAIIEQIDAGTALQAARCSLGCLGVIVSVTMVCRKQYLIEEHLRDHATLESVLQAEAQYPLQQFFFNPWSWKFLAQHRRESPGPRSRLARLYRAYWFVTIDICLHLLILTPLRLLPGTRTLKFLFRNVIPNSVVRGWKVTDDSASMLVMEHELFRHIEMELFVTRDRLAAALEYVRAVLTVAGSSAAAPDVKMDHSEAARLESLRKTYVHHYPICIRRVMPDDTLISASSGLDQDSYAISLISYALPKDRQGFANVMGFLAETMSKRFGARPHWGKFCPLSAQQMVALFPRFHQFRSECERRDPTGVFRNQWMTDLFAADS